MERRVNKTELQENAEKFRRVFSPPDAFDTLVQMAILYKWRGELESAEDVAVHNAFERLLAMFGGNDTGHGWSEKQIRDQLRSAIGSNLPTTIERGVRDVGL